MQLGLSAANDPRFCRFRDLRDGGEYLRPAAALYDGLTVTLGPYQYHVFHAFRLFADEDGSWAALYAAIGDGPVADLDLARLRLRYRREWQGWQRLVAPERLQVLAEHLLTLPLTAAARSLAAELDADLATLAGLLGGDGPQSATLPALADDLTCLGRWLGSREAAVLRSCWHGPAGLAYPWLCWRLLAHLDGILPPADRPLWPRLQAARLAAGLERNPPGRPP